MVSFTFREDRVSQEVNEMVRLELVMVQGIISPDADLRLQLDLTIVDATGKASPHIPNYDSLNVAKCLVI